MSGPAPHPLPATGRLTDVPQPPSVALATTLIDAAVAGGVTDAVLAPGSRNAPLSMALFDADAAGRIRLHVRVDERSAGFVAVGLARATGRPALVCTTSGTAVGNLVPAVLEAHHGAVPMVVLTADRPPELRALGANQVIDQQQVFRPALRWFAELDTPTGAGDELPAASAAILTALAAAAGAPGPPPGPAQLNLPLKEPLLPNDNEPLTAPAATDGAVTRAGTRADTTDTRAGAPVAAAGPVTVDDPGEKVLFVADLTHPAAGAVAAAGHPVVSEAGGAAGSRVLNAGIWLLDNGIGFPPDQHSATGPDPAAGHDGAGDGGHGDRNSAAAPPGWTDCIPDRVVVLGRPTLYRSVTRLLANTPVIDVVGPTGPIADPTGRARRVAQGLGLITHPAPQGFRLAWEQADRSASAVLRSRLRRTDIAQSPALAAAVLDALPDPATLVLGSSQSPRDVGRFGAGRDGVRIIANRGVAGIDGIVSTAVGAALAAGAPTAALLGDLAFVHDLNGLVIGPHEPVPDVTIVVSNNDGGAIFSTLEPGETLHARAFERVFGTPHGVDVAAACQAVGAEHVLVTDIGQLRAELRTWSGIRVLEVPTVRSELRGFLADTGVEVAAALGLGPA